MQTSRDWAKTPSQGGRLFAVKNGSMLQVAGLNLDKEKAIVLANLALAHR